MSTVRDIVMFLENRGDRAFVGNIHRHDIRAFEIVGDVFIRGRLSDDNGYATCQQISYYTSADEACSASDQKFHRDHLFPLVTPQPLTAIDAKQKFVLGTVEAARSSPVAVRRR